MFRAVIATLRKAFGDAEPPVWPASSAKLLLLRESVAIEKRAAAIERLSLESDAESKALVLAYASDAECHPWLQQCAGEAVADMIRNNRLNAEEVTSLTEGAGETAVDILTGRDAATFADQISLLKLATRRKVGSSSSDDR